MPRPKTIQIQTPTDNRRHTAKIRYGKFSHESWSKENLSRIPVDFDAQAKK